MGLRSTLSSLLSAPVAAAIETRVRQLVDAALDARDLADPGRVRDLSVEVEKVRRTAEEVRAEVARLAAAVGALGEGRSDGDDVAVEVAALVDRDAAFDATLEHLQARVQALGDLALEVRRAVEVLERREHVPPVVAERPVAAADRGCKVEGCTAEHRARGFCGRHYQMWKRGTLPGFVNEGGLVLFEDDARRWKVDAAHGGEPVEKAPRGLKIGGRKVEAELLG